MADHDLLAALLQLPPDERARLGLALIRSLTDSPESFAAAAWDAELERRAAEVDDGTADTITLEAYRAQVRRRRLRRHR